MSALARVPVFFALMVAAVSAQDPGAKASVRALGNAFASVYEKVGPSVV